MDLRCMTLEDAWDAALAAATSDEKSDIAINMMLTPAEFFSSSPELSLDAQVSICIYFAVRAGAIVKT